MSANAIKIFVDENEYDFESKADAQSGEFKFDSATSVNRLKAHFFEGLAGLGNVVKYNRARATAGSTIARAIAGPDAMVASFHEPPPDIPLRLLQHTKGGLMLPGGFLGQWTLRESTMNLVETTRQILQLKNSCHMLPLALRVFAQRLATDVFFPSATRRNGCLAENSIVHGAGYDLVYAGRLIPNKGIAQLVRSLNLWPLAGCKLSVIGEWEPDFLISQAGVSCAHFKTWFNCEVMSRNKIIDIRILPPMPQENLADFFRNTNAFIYPSFHEDEASGNAAHEAVLTGIPAIVSDWCGLGQLGRNTRGGTISTYPTLGGIRYSLKSLRMRVSEVCSADTRAKEETVNKDIEWVRSTFDPHGMINSLRSGLEDLIRFPVAPSLPGGWRCLERIHHIARLGPISFKKALSVGSDAVPPGLYVDGTGYEEGKYSHAHFLTAIQGLYTTWLKPPLIQPGTRLHGFWRVALWENERALVEFGFPGPRLLRFSASEWRIVCNAAQTLMEGDFTFEILDHRVAAVFQRAVDLGYLVPDNPMKCELSESNDRLP